MATFKRKTAKDLINSSEKLKEYKRELRKSMTKLNKNFKTMNEILEKSIGEELNRREEMERNKGRFLKWLRAFKKAFGVKGVMWLLSEADRIKDFYDPYENFPRSYYNLHGYLYNCLMELKNKKEDTRAIQYLDNLGRYDGEYLDTLALVAGAMLNCSSASMEVPAYNSF